MRLLIILSVIILTGCNDEETRIGGGQPPPFSGTIFIAPHLINDDDPTSYVSITYSGKSERKMLDRRVDKFITLNAHLFVATFDDGVELEIQVNPEFDADRANVEAEKYSKVIGQMPYTLRGKLVDVAIHNGDAPFSGNKKNIVIHTMQGDKYLAEGILAETLIHETVHAVIDKEHEKNVQWINAQKSDLGFISTYAQKHPYREDLAESFVPYLASRFKPDRISHQLKQTIDETILYRMAYLDGLNISLYPMVTSD